MSQVIVSYRITCDSEIDIEVKNLNTITLYDLPPETNLSCAIAAASSGGYGPYSPAISVITEGQTSFLSSLFCKNSSLSNFMDFIILYTYFRCCGG